MSLLLLNREPQAPEKLTQEYHSGLWVRPKGGLILMDAENGGDFGNSEFGFTPEEARRVADALLKAALKAEAQ